jgi:hypothetical protein
MPDSGGEQGAGVVAADANADEHPEPGLEDLASALARAPADTTPEPAEPTAEP